MQIILIAYNLILFQILNKELWLKYNKIYVDQRFELQTLFYKIIALIARIIKLNSCYFHASIKFVLVLVSTS